MTYRLELPIYELSSKSRSCKNKASGPFGMGPTLVLGQLRWKTIAALVPTLHANSMVRGALLGNSPFG